MKKLDVHLLCAGLGVVLRGGAGLLCLVGGEVGALPRRIASLLSRLLGARLRPRNTGLLVIQLSMKKTGLHR